MTQVRMTITEFPEATVVGFEEVTTLETGRVETIAPELFALIDRRRATRLIVDLAGVSSFGSHALGILLTLHKKARSIGGRVALCGVSPALKSVFEVTNLHRVFDIHADVESSRKAMQ